MKNRWIMGVLLLAGLLNGCAGLSISARHEYEQGLSLFNQGQYEKAIPYFAKVTEAEPEYPGAYLYLGRAHLSLGQWQKAIPPLRTAFNLSPEKARGEVVQLLIDAFFGLTQSYMKKGDLVQAAQTLQEALQLMPDSSAGAPLLQELLQGSPANTGK